jgi:alginate O-acetyltransferase complex protein AlgJ
MKSSKLRHPVLFSLLFCLWIAVPLLYDLFSRSKEILISQSENRMLARRPKLACATLPGFPAAYDKYYNDHFVLRWELIHWNSYLVSYLFFHKSPVPAEVDLGLNGWLYSAGKEREVYEGKYSLPESYLEAISNEMSLRNRWYAERGITFYLAIAPMKCEIYPENLPSFYHRSKSGTLTDILLARFRKDTSLRIIELKPAMIAAKEKGALYYPTDNHWNAIGAYWAYRSITDRMQLDFPKIEPLTADDFRIVSERGKGGNLATMIGLYEFLHETFQKTRITHPRSVIGVKAGYPSPKGFSYPDEYELVRLNPDTTLPRIVVIRDSFFTALLPYMSENFSKSVYIFDNWKYERQEEIVTQEKPDIVLLMLLESNLSQVLSSLAKP